MTDFDPAPFQESCVACHGPMEANGWRTARYASDAGVGRRQRLRCSDCGRTRYPDEAGLSRRHRMSAGQEAWIGQECMNRPFSAVAVEAGIDEKTAKAAFETWVASEIEGRGTHCPSIVGLAYLTACREQRPFLFDAERLTLQDVAVSPHDIKTVLPRPGNVSAVFCDMSTEGLKLAGERWPDAEIGVDIQSLLDAARRTVARFLAIRRTTLGPDGRDALSRAAPVIMLDAEERAPCQVQALLDAQTAQPEIGVIAAAKDAFWAIWEARDAGSAQEAARRWQRSRHAAVLTPLSDMIEAWGGPATRLYDMPELHSWSLALHDLKRATLGPAHDADRRGLTRLRAHLLIGGGRSGVAMVDLPAACGRAFHLRQVTSKDRPYVVPESRSPVPRT